MFDQSELWASVWLITVLGWCLTYQIQVLVFESYPNFWLWSIKDKVKFHSNTTTYYTFHSSDTNGYNPIDIRLWVSFDNPSLCPTCCFIIGFLPVENNEGGASFHGYNSEVGWGCSWRVGDILFSTLLLRKVTQRGGDGAGLIWLLICLIDHMWSWTTTHLCLNSDTYLLCFGSETQISIIQSSWHARLQWLRKSRYQCSVLCPGHQL